MTGRATVHLLVVLGAALAAAAIAWFAPTATAEPISLDLAIGVFAGLITAITHSAFSRV